MNEMRDKKGAKCHCYRYPKVCIKEYRVLKCRDNCKKSRGKNKCQHGRQKKIDVGNVV